MGPSSGPTVFVKHHNERSLHSKLIWLSKPMSPKLLVYTAATLLEVVV